MKIIIQKQTQPNKTIQHSIQVYNNVTKPNNTSHNSTQLSKKKTTIHIKKQSKALQTVQNITQAIQIFTQKKLYETLAKPNTTLQELYKAIHNCAELCTHSQHFLLHEKLHTSLQHLANLYKTNTKLWTTVHN